MSLLKFNLKIGSYRGHNRSINIQKNIIVSFLAKGGTILINLAFVPLTIDYVNPKQYGIWLTLSSIIGWFGFLDIGFGNGLQNKLSESIAKGDNRLSKIYVSTTYLILCLISSFILVTFFIVNHFIDWGKVLNAGGYHNELNTVALIVVCIFCFQFVLQLINIISAAKQKTMLTALIYLLGNCLSLTVIFILIRFTTGSLLYLCLAVGLSPILIQLIFSLSLYMNSYKEYSPSLKFADFKYAKDLMGVGLKFFLIQIGVLFFYNTDNIIISQLFGPESVTSYNIAYKYFSVITVLSGIIMTPFWPAFTEANVKKDYEWIRSSVKRLSKICLLILILSLIMLLLSNRIYHFWVGSSIVVPVSLSVLLSFYTALNAYRTIFCYYANGVGKLKVQVILVLTSGLLNIPLAFFLGQYLGVAGIVLSTTILSACCAVVEITQYKKLINNRASGIWNK